MEYVRHSIRAPVLQGVSRRVATALLERRIPGALVAGVSFNAVGLSRFRHLPGGGAPLYEPLIPHGDAATRRGTAPLPSREDAEAIPGTLPEEHQEFDSARRYAREYRQGTTTPVEVAHRICTTLAERNHGNAPLYSFISWNPQDIERQAQESALRISRGEPRSVLEGVPVAVKDEIDVAGYGTTAGTQFLGKEPAGEDSFVVARLRAAGAVILGKTTMHEIGIGITGINRHWGTPLNPYAPDRCPGGSSSGSASAIASGLCPIALGADGGGSVRIPAAHCGIFGLKTTWGSTSARGEFPLGYTVGNIGPMAATAGDLALAWVLVSGADPREPATLSGPAPDLRRIPATIDGVRIGIDPRWFDHGDPLVVAAARDLLNALRERGARLVEIEIPWVDDLRLAHLATIAQEMLSAMSPYCPQHLRDFGGETRASLALARHLTTGDYLRAQQVRRTASVALRSIMETTDIIATPTTAILPPRVPQERMADGPSDLGVMDATMRFTTLANMLGNPAISVPSGFTPEGVPMGMQLIGRHWEEGLLIGVAAVAEGLIPRKVPRGYLSPLEGASRGTHP